MPKYREIIGLKSLGFSERNIASSGGILRNTATKVAKCTDELQLKWLLVFDIADNIIGNLISPKGKATTNKYMPDYNCIRKELLRNGVNKKLLWVEYCEECLVSGDEPLMNSQFRYYVL